MIPLDFNVHLPIINNIANGRPGPFTILIPEFSMALSRFMKLTHSLVLCRKPFNFNGVTGKVIIGSNLAALRLISGGNFCIINWTVSGSGQTGVLDER